MRRSVRLNVTRGISCGLAAMEICTKIKAKVRDSDEFGRNDEMGLV